MADRMSSSDEQAKRVHPRLDKRRKSTSLSAGEDRQKFIEMIEEEAKKKKKAQAEEKSTKETKRRLTQENPPIKVADDWQPHSLRLSPREAKQVASGTWRGEQAHSGDALETKHLKEKKKGGLTLRLSTLRGKKEKDPGRLSAQIPHHDFGVHETKEVAFPLNTEWKRKAHAQSENDLAAYIDLLPKESQEAASQLAKAISQETVLSARGEAPPKATNNSPRDSRNYNHSNNHSRTHSNNHSHNKEEQEHHQSKLSIEDSSASLKWKKKDEMAIFQSLMDNTHLSHEDSKSPRGTPKPTPRKDAKKEDSKSTKKAATQKKEDSKKKKKKDDSKKKRDEETEEERAATLLVYQLLLESQKKKEEARKRQEAEERLKLEQERKVAAEEEEESKMKEEEEGLSLEEKYERLKERYEKQFKLRRNLEKELEAVDMLLTSAGGARVGLDATLSVWQEAKKLPPEAKLRTIKQKAIEWATMNSDSTSLSTPRSLPSTPSGSNQSFGLRTPRSSELIRTESTIYDVIPKASREPSRPSLMFAKKIAISFSRDLNAFLSANPGEITSSKAQAFLDSFNISDADLLKGGIIGGEEDEEIEDVKVEEKDKKKESSKAVVELQEGGYNNEEDLLFDAVEVVKRKTSRAGEEDNKLWKKHENLNVESESEEESEESSSSDSEEDDGDDSSDDGAIGELDEGGGVATRTTTTTTTTKESKSNQKEKEKEKEHEREKQKQKEQEEEKKDERKEKERPKTPTLMINEESADIVNLRGEEQHEIERLKKVLEKKQKELDKLRQFMVTLVEEEGHQRAIKKVEAFKKEYLKKNNTGSPKDDEIEEKEEEGKEKEKENEERKRKGKEGKEETSKEEEELHRILAQRSGSTALYEMMSAGALSLLVNVITDDLAPEEYEEAEGKENEERKRKGRGKGKEKGKEEDWDGSGSAHLYSTLRHGSRNMLSDSSDKSDFDEDEEIEDQSKRSSHSKRSKRKSKSKKGEEDPRKKEKKDKHKKAK